MASLITNQGLQRAGINTSQVGGAGAVGSSQTVTRYLMTMSADDSTTAFAATDTALNSGGAVTNEFDALLDAFPTRSAQTVSHVMTIPSGSFNGVTIRRIALHDDTATNVTTSSTTLYGGISGQSIAKTTDFSLAITVQITYS